MDTSIIILSEQDEIFRNLFNWELTPNGYIRVRLAIKSTIVTLSLHRFIYGRMSGGNYYQDTSIDIDHVNRNKLDNTRTNLRLATRSQNNFNGEKRGGTSKYKGVHYSNSHGKWIANITVFYKNIYLGIYACEESAAYAYDVAVELASAGQGLKNNVEVSEKAKARISAHVIPKIQAILAVKDARFKEVESKLILDAPVISQLTIKEG